MTRAEKHALRRIRCAAADLPAVLRECGRDVLGIVAYGVGDDAAGGTPRDDGKEANVPAGPPLARVHHRPLQGPACEVWLGADATATQVDTNGVRCRNDGAVLFGTVAVDAPGGAIEAAGHRACCAMLDCVVQAGFPRLLRVWNTLPHIHAEDAGLERYRAFNRSRFRAFSESRQPTHAGAPAASALGSRAGPLSLHFLAVRDAPVAIENPRQVSAYDYPPEHGPRAPNFSRAAVWRGRLFVSGTASIVGHASLHPGDVQAQTQETLRNLAAIVEACAARDVPGVRALADLEFKAYLRRPADLAVVRAQLAAHGIDTDRVLFVEADVCRADLLVEIEAAGPASSL
jgi:enamine deaminase RidA (YjgF/YER057c/UK114 family)